jgi:hypothetical protein
MALLLIIVASVAITVWWIQRPIKPVVLSAREKAAVDEKIRVITGETSATSVTGLAANTNRPPHGDPPILEIPDRSRPTESQERPYTPGAKVLKLTEREINGLLNLNTDLGKTVRLEFAKDAVHAYLAVPIPKDFPIAGGMTFRARGRFLLSLGNGGAPYAVLEDVTVFGLSLPKAWLGGIKNKNLLGEVMGKGDGSPVLPGVKSLRIEPGALVLEVTE